MQFNNAGIMHPEDDTALNTEERIWDLTMAINLKGVWWGSKYAILAMRNNATDEAKGLHIGGSIINTASFVAIMGAATPQLACELFAVCRSVGVDLRADMLIAKIPRPRSSLLPLLLRASAHECLTCPGRRPGHDA